MTVPPAQEFKLLAGFNVLCDNIDSRAPGHGDDGLDNGGVIFFSDNITNKGLVDFQAIDGKIFKIIQRGISRAEIIDGEMDAPVL